MGRLYDKILEFKKNEKKPAVDYYAVQRIHWHVTVCSLLNLSSYRPIYISHMEMTKYSYGRTILRAT